MYYAVDPVAWTIGSAEVYTDGAPPNDNAAAWYTSATAGAATAPCAMFGVPSTYVMCRAVPVFNTVGTLGGVTVGGMMMRTA